MDNIHLSTDAKIVIESLRHSAGTHELYQTTLTRLFNQILHAAEDLGMDELEALETLRVLDMIRHDLAILAFTPSFDDDEADEETDDEVNSDFGPTEAGPGRLELPGDKLDEPREMLADVNRGFLALQRATAIIEEAAHHASNAGEKYRAVCEDLNDISEDLSIEGARLDAIMAIDPDDSHEITDEESTTIEGN